MSAPNRATPEDVTTALRLARGIFDSAATLAERLTGEHVEASSALVALGQADDGRTLAERIGAHTETMRHLSIARADVAIIHEALAVTPGETAIGAARRARSTIEALRAEVARLTKALAEAEQDAGEADDRGESIASDSVADRDALRGVRKVLEEEGIDVDDGLVDGYEAGVRQLVKERDALREKARAVCDLEWGGAFRLSDQDTPAFDALRAEVDR